MTADDRMEPAGGSAARACATTVLLADDQEMTRQGIRSLIETRPEFLVVADVGDGESAIHKIESLKPDVAVLEFALPHLSALAVIERAHSGGSKTRFLILSERPRDQHVRDALSVGASGFLLKSASASQLFNAIQVAHRGQFFLSPEISHVVVEAARDPHRTGQSVLLGLTTRELEILQLIAEGFSTKEVSSRLGISCRTSDSHRASVMRKLGVHKVVGLVRFAIREGLVDA